jgi:hypothetical protein
MPSSGQRRKGTRPLTAPASCADAAEGHRGVLPGGTGDISGDNVGGVPVETAAGAVVSHGGPGISVGGGFLHIS